MIHDKIIIIGIAGGTGSGKTTVSNSLIKIFGELNVVFLQHDFYYYDHSHLTKMERNEVNYDHPNEIETSLLVKHILQLKDGNSVDVPIYDFKAHTRKKKKLRKEPRRIILLEGVLLFTNGDLRNLLDIKVFVDTDADIRFIRRLERDIAERGRSMRSVIKQYLSTVKPMHQKFVEPSREYADIIISEGGFNEEGLQRIIDRVQKI